MDLEQALFKAFEKEIRSLQGDIVERHLKEMTEEFNKKSADIVSRIGLQLSKHMSITTLEDRIIVEVFDKRKS